MVCYQTTLKDTCLGLSFTLKNIQPEMKLSKEKSNSKAKKEENLSGI
jgi:hypothetical protein